MSIQIEEGKRYLNRAGSVVGPVRHNDAGELGPTTDEVQLYVFRDDAGSTFTASGHYYGSGQECELDLVAEHKEQLSEQTPLSALAGNKASILIKDDIEVDANQIFYGDGPDVKASILAEAGKIVNGARRSAYGTPERNFERIARFWQAYFENTGRGDVNITAADVSPLMRLMKEARLCESPAHRDSFVDIIGYTLTGAEVNGVPVEA